MFVPSCPLFKEKEGFVLVISGVFFVENNNCITTLTVEANHAF